MNKLLKQAFTLIELLVVIAIIGILSGLIVVSMNGVIDSANDARRKDNIDAVRKALTAYGALNGKTYPIETSGCNIGPVGIVNRCTNFTTALSEMLPTLPIDPVSGYYTYSSNGSDFVLSSNLSSGKSYGYSSAKGYHSSIFARSSAYTKVKNTMFGSVTNVDDSANGASWGYVANFTAGWASYVTINSANGFTPNTYDIYIRIRTNNAGSNPTSFSTVGIYDSDTSSVLANYYGNATGFTTAYQIKYLGSFTLTEAIKNHYINLYFSSSGVTTNYYLDYIEFRVVP